MYLDLSQVICQEMSDNSDDKLYCKQICNVCEVGDDGSYKCICFSTSEMENEMIQNFITCGKYNGAHNEIFKYCWNQQMLSSKIRDQDVSFDSVFIKVWKPTIAECQSLLCKLKNKTITLNECEVLYTKGSFLPQLSALCNAMHQCYPDCKDLFPPPDKWVSQTVQHIALYHDEIVSNSSKCTVAAGVILKVKESLKLDGDFQIIEHFAKHVSTYTYTCTQPHMYAYSHACKQTMCIFISTYICTQ